MINFLFYIAGCLSTSIAAFAIHHVLCHIHALEYRRRMVGLLERLQLFTEKANTHLACNELGPAKQTLVAIWGALESNIQILNDAGEKD